jgi:hypothetical protein
MSGKGWWNSALSGLESRLDTILAEEAQATARSRAGDAAATPDARELAAAEKLLAVEPGGLSSAATSSLESAWQLTAHKHRATPPEPGRTRDCRTDWPRP